MKKKTKKKSTRSRKRHSFHISTVSLLIAAVSCIILGFFYFSHPPIPKTICANSISCINDLSGRFQEGQIKGIFLGKQISVPSFLAKSFEQPPVLGESTNSQKHIFIDLSIQKLYAYDGNTLVYNFPISSGKWYPTPTGDFRIWVKLRYTRMSGGSQSLGTYYNVPNVPYTMFFSNNEHPKSSGFGVHGAYWHNNFGHPMSHGCVNLRTEDAKKLYNWASPETSGYTTYVTEENPGTPITIYGQAPTE